jgi:class 3 adenylate cyclase
MNSPISNTQCHIKSIATKILEDKCVIVCGSQLSALVNEYYANHQIAAYFLSEHSGFFARLTGGLDEYRGKSLPELFQAWIHSPDGNEYNHKTRGNWISTNFLRHYFDPEQNPSTSHMVLVNLGCKYIYTTNYDRLIEEAYIRAGFPRDAINVVSADSAAPCIQFDFPYVYKLCGTAGEANISLAEIQFTNGEFNFGDEMRLRLLRRTIVFVGYNSLDEIMLSPIVRTIESSFPEAYYCVTNSASSLPNCLSCLGGAMSLLELDISDFLSQLYMEILSQTSDLFGYLSTKRKIVEHSAIAFLRTKINNIDSSRVRDIGLKLNEQRERMEKRSSVGNSWYWDFSFHQSLYKVVPAQVFEKDFAKIYLKLRVFYSTYQSKSTLAEHEEIYKNLVDKNVMATARSLNRHLRNVSETAGFWLKYFTSINKDILQAALHDYQTPLITEDDIQLDDRILKEHRKILVLGESNSGKTTFSVRQVILSITTGASIPIYIDFRSSQFGEDQISALAKSGTFELFLLQYFYSLNLSSKMLRYIIAERVMNGEFLLVLDGVEKLFGGLGVNLLERISLYVSETHGIKLIITSQDDLLLRDGRREVFMSEIIGFTCNQTYTLPVAKPVNISVLAGSQCELALVFVDIVDSTSISLLLGDESVAELKRLHFAQVDRLTRKLQGKKIKENDDEHLAAFWNAGLALDYALQLQENSGCKEFRIRAGIHVGYVKVTRQHDVDGLTINYTKRVIDEIGTASEIWLSNEAKKQVDKLRRRRHNELRWQAIEDLELRGFSDTHVLWRLHQD